MKREAINYQIFVIMFLDIFSYAAIATIVCLYSLVLIECVAYNSEPKRNLKVLSKIIGMYYRFRERLSQKVKWGR